MILINFSHPFINLDAVRASARAQRR